MKLKKTPLLVFALLLFLTPLLQAEEWLIRGARARAMGGAQVADSQGTMSAYWNPAALAFGPKAEKDKTPPLPIEILLADFGMEAAVTGGLAKDAFDLKDALNGIDGGISGLQNKFQTATGVTQNDINSLLTVLDILGRFDKNSNKGVFVTVQGSFLDIQVGSFALTSQLVIYGGVNPLLNLTVDNMLSSTGFGSDPTLLFGLNVASVPVPINTALRDQLVSLGASTQQANALVGFAEQQNINTNDPFFQSVITSVVQNTASGGTGTIDNNQTGVLIKGLALAEVRASAALQLIPKILAVGGNLKIMQGVTFSRLIVLNQFNELSNIFKEVYDNIKEQTQESVQFTCDAGVLVKLGMIQVGLTGRNLIPTQYKAPGRDFVLDSQLRAGAALNLGWLTVALDLDLTPNRSFSSDEFNSQMIGGGVEIVPVDLGIFSLALRAGMYRNLAEPTESEVYTLGFGIKLWMVKLDAAASLDSKAIKNGNYSLDFQNKSYNDIPDRVGYSMTLSVGFSF